MPLSSKTHQTGMAVKKEYNLDIILVFLLLYSPDLSSFE